MIWKPLNETYFVRPDPIEVSPLILDEYKKKHVSLITGVVTHVGTGVLMENGTRAPLQAKVGDRVLFGAEVGAEVKVDGEKLLLLAEPNVLAIQKTEEKALSKEA
jgi:co-chaperonin GroES (HSP10)